MSRRGETTKVSERTTKKGIVRSLVRRGSRSDQRPPVVKREAGLHESTLCLRCGAVYLRKTWRWAGRQFDVEHTGSSEGVCPACHQVREREYFGRVLMRGPFLAEHEVLIRHRIENVARRARYTQPERRVIDIVRHADGLEVLTTSQKLAHRIVREMLKSFHGQATYSWSDRNGALFATWSRPDVME